MTQNTLECIEEMNKTLDEFENQLNVNKTLLNESCKEIEEKFRATFAEQREEIIRVRVNLDRIYSEERQRRLRALKRLKSE